MNAREAGGPMTESQTTGPICESADDAATDAAIHDRPYGERARPVGGPSPLCFVCLSDKPKLRAIEGGHEILCDDCFGAMFTTKGCDGDA